MSSLKSLFIVPLCLLLAACSQEAASEPAPPETSQPGLGTPADTAGATPSAAADESASAAKDASIIELKPENTQIQFIGTHAGDKPDPRVGVFMKFAGQAKLGADRKSLKSVSVEIQTDSLKTQIPKLTNHLKSPDFFDAREYPTAKFESTKISTVDGEPDRRLISGKLTLLKTTMEISFPAKVEVADGKVTLDGALTIDRTEYGMDKLADRVSKEVDINVAIGKMTDAP